MAEPSLKELSATNAFLAAGGTSLLEVVLLRRHGDW
jgi:hypothetical protein